MAVLTLVGEDAEGNLMNFHIINPMNLVVNVGKIQKPGTLTDGAGKPIMVTEERTLVHIGGQPLFIRETVDAVIEKAKAL